MMIEEQLRLGFVDRMPRRPYCSDDLGNGLKIRGIDIALKHKYIQPNPPGLKYWLVFDIDRPGAALAWENGLPPPNWVATNPENGHAHMAWGVEIPVYTASEARLKPLRLAAAIEDTYTERLRADKFYAGLITKNPVHESWRVQWLTAHLYDLGELAEYVDLTKIPLKKPRRKVNSELGGLFRNVQLFDSLRYWAYDAVLGFRLNGSNFDAWLKAVSEKANGLNVFPAPLPENEVMHTAKSVARWVWKHYTGRMTDEAFSARQAARGKRRAVQRRHETSESIRRAYAGILEAGQCPTKVAVAAAAGLSREALTRDYKQLWSELEAGVNLAISSPGTDQKSAPSLYVGGAPALAV
jgi:hypothetical protein